MISLSAVTFMKLVILYSDTHVRLTGYNLTHAGRVEVFSNGVWGRVCNVWGSWRQKEAAVVCRQLGFQGVIAAFSSPSDSAQFMVMSRVQCVGNETSLQQCQHDDFVNIIPLDSCQEVGVVCKPHNFYSDDGKVSIRLQGSSLPNAGRIEILYAGVWGAISSYHWDINDATVVCRQLGYKAGAEAALRNRVYGPFMGPVWLKNLQCIGREKHMMECAHDGIANKTERSPATRFASVICKDGKMPEELKVRLRGSHQPNMGRIEVYFAGKWGAIHPWFLTSSMKRNALKVVCRQLGYAGDSLSGYNIFCSEAVLPWFTNLRCKGSETSLDQCGLDFSSHTSVKCMNVLCTNEKAASGYALRLSGSSNPHAGRVEIKILGIWGSIFLKHGSLDRHFSSETQRVMCRQLGYDDSILETIWLQIGQSHRLRWFRDYEIRCSGNERNIRDCISSPLPQLRRQDHNFAADLGVVCKPNVSQINDFQVRLTGSSLPSAGAIEVLYYGVWGGMLGYFIDIRVGHVICRQLGYSVAQQVFRKSVFGHVNGPLLIEQTRCNGNESDISQCTVIAIDHKSYWYYFNVRDRAGVRCAELQVESSKDFRVRLAGSPISNAGQVELFYAGVWGTINSYQWNIKNAHVVCRQLGYPGAISSGASSQFGVGKQTPVLFSNVRCLGNESTLQECAKSFAGFIRRGGATALCKLPYQPDSSLSCSDLNCTNNGECIGNAAGAVCKCTDGFAGLHCQIPLSTPCKSSPCKNGGQCFSNNSSYVCICPDRLTGKQCQERTLNDNILYMKGNTAFNSYIMVISVSVIVTLVVTVVCLILKIRKLTAQQTTQPTNPSKMYGNNTFQAEPVGEPLDEQRTSPTNIDSMSGYACIDDINANFRDYADDVEMSSLFLPPIPSKRPKRRGPLIQAPETPVNNNPEEPSPETLKVHYMGLLGIDKNKNEAITNANKTASYMHLSPSRPDYVVYSGLSHISGGVAVTPKPGVKYGSETKGHAYACLQKK